MVVVDTSVVVKWFVPELDSDRALALRAAHVAGRIPLATADLCLVELANALRFRRPTPTPEEIGQAVRRFLPLT
jgi:predicted nucleic acid-binding protein